jgi:hypothetical protein
MVMDPTSLKKDSLAIPAPLEMTTGPEATRETLPPWLPARTPLWMVAPPVRVSDPNCVQILPGSPSSGAEGSAKKLAVPIPVKGSWIDADPVEITLTSPPRPGPMTALEIWAPFLIVS